MQQGAITAQHDHHIHVRIDMIEFGTDGTLAKPVDHIPADLFHLTWAVRDRFTPAKAMFMRPTPVTAWWQPRRRPLIVPRTAPSSNA